MKKISTFVFVLIFATIAMLSYGQTGNQNGYKLTGTNTTHVDVNQSVTQNTMLKPFEGKFSRIYGLAVSGEVEMTDDQSLVRVILTATNGNEYLVYEMYTLLAGTKLVKFDQVCEESCLLNGITPESLMIEVHNATFKLNTLTLASALPPGIDIAATNKEKHQLRENNKISSLNQNLSARGMSWAAGSTDVSKLSFAERKLLYGKGTFPPGMEYYIGGVLQAGSQSMEATASLMVDTWDWRNRHGKNWITSIKNQANCGSCWAFAVTGATEAQVNLYFNQLLNLDLAEQDVLSCSGAGTCSGGYPSTALSYIAGTGIVNEGAFPYTAIDQPCSNKSTTPSQLIKIAGRVDFGSGAYSATEDNLKKMIIKYGPLSGGLYDWSHAMPLVGWQVVKEGDRFLLRDTNLNIAWITVPAGSPLIGQTVWMFKNSWGNWGDGGYVYVQTTMSNIGWTHALLNPVQSLKQTYSVAFADNDHDGYYWWGLGPKPAGCNCPDTPDGDDNNANLGPLDAYGNCIVIGAPPVINFTADKFSVPAKSTVAFTDLSTNAPTSWAWSFPGGTPSTSGSQNPVITYNAPGVYSVSLTVTNSGGSSSKTADNYISVTEPVYCGSTGYAVDEWIQSVTLGSNSFVSGTSGSSGYQDLTASVAFTVESGSKPSIVLTPKFASRARSEYWNVWIDFNGDKDFDDSGELVFTSSRNSGVASGTITIPSDLTTNTRMRISMKRNSTPTSCEVFTQGEVEDYTLIVTSAQPVNADFSASPTIILAGGTVQFSDASLGNPTSWSWSFPGGNPASSSAQNPLIQYLNPGTYSVTLIASKTESTDTETKTEYIIVNPAPPVDYCPSIAISSTDYIKGVIIGSIINNTSGGDGYSKDAGPNTFVSGQTYATTLTPFNNSNRNYWRIWIDFNQDGDFNDSGETVLTVNNKKGVLTASITMPLAAVGTTRMRISMKTGSAMAPCDNGFIGEVEDYIITFSSSGIDLKNVSTFVPPVLMNPGSLIYPNPAGEELNIQLDGIITVGTCSIFNAQGTLVGKKQINNPVSKINVSRLAPGMYFIIIENGQSVTKEKFVKR